MNKAAVIERIEEAKKSHLRWLELIKQLRKGEVESFTIPVRDDECDFGKWLLDEGVKLKRLEGFEILELIKKYHMELHENFQKIYEICYGSVLNLAFMKFLRIKKELSPQEKRQVKEAYKKILIVSKSCSKSSIFCKSW